MTRARSQHPAAPQRPAHNTPEVPVVVPHVVMIIDASGAMTVTVDGDAYKPEPFAPPWRRESFATLIDQLTDQHQSPLRVEVREADGTVFTDIITGGRRRQPRLTPPHETAPVPVPPATSPALVEFTGDGFVPGEDVAVAIVIAHTGAAPTGTARTLLTAEHAALAPTGEAVLLGRISGIFTIGRLG